MKKFIGDKAFYKMLFILVLPLIVQQGVTSFVSLLDNLMVGKLGTEQMSSVAIVNQLIFVFNLTIFGGVSGASIFGAQFAGVGDDKGLRHSFRFKIIFGIAASVIAVVLLYFCGDALTLWFLDNEANADLDLTVLLTYAKEYLRVMLIGLVPFMIVQVYSSTLRETGDTVVPMIASVTAILVNLAFNYFLIFGTFGFPRLEVRGAAIATVLSRYVEMLVIVLYTHIRKSKFRFAVGAFRSPY
ncbi:MAG: polysaccharide biosynthesis C-terminal domain-containing protein, partial [Clostridia bacterium]|nr:polysaccharide biosynthesis C-terminal domain-containing protein [Clostridia bacterium]